MPDVYDSESLIKLVITPAHILEQVVTKKLSKSILLNANELQKIVGQNDVALYCWLQDCRELLLPKYVSRITKDGLGVDYNSADYKLANVQFKELKQNKARLLYSIASTPRVDQIIKSSADNDNTYVGHYYAIDKETIGVVFMYSTSVLTDERKSLAGLISLLASSYLGSVHGVADNSNDVHIVNITKLGLLEAYATL